MFCHWPKTLVGNDIFLPANMTKPAQHLRVTVQAIFLFSFGLMAHAKKFLKNSDKQGTSPNVAPLQQRHPLFLTQTIFL
jgi:hypothetical protein